MTVIDQLAVGDETPDLRGDRLASRTRCVTTRDTARRWAGRGPSRGCLVDCERAHRTDTSPRGGRPGAGASERRTLRCRAGQGGVGSLRPRQVALELPCITPADRALRPQGADGHHGQASLTTEGAVPDETPESGLAKHPPGMVHQGFVTQSSAPRRQAVQPMVERAVGREHEHRWIGVLGPAGTGGLPFPRRRRWIDAWVCVLVQLLAAATRCRW